MWQYIKVVFLVGPKVIYYWLFYAHKYAKHPEKYPIQLRYIRVRKLVLKLFKVWKIKHDCVGLEQLNQSKEKLVLISNHLSDLDALFMVAVSQKPLCFVSKKEVFKFPFVGTICKSLSFISLDRDNLMAQVQAVNDAIKLAKDGIAHLVIYGEGTRNRHPENKTLEFKPGTFKIAYKANVSILPVAIYSTFRPLKPKYQLRKYCFYANFLDKIDVNTYKTTSTIEFAPIFEEKLNNSIDELREKDQKFLSSLKLSQNKMNFLNSVNIRVNE